MNVLDNDIKLKDFALQLLEKFVQTKTDNCEFELLVPSQKLNVKMRFLVKLELAAKH